MQYSWHGNIRELKYVMERACILCPGNSITPEYLPSELMLNAKSFFSSHTLHPSSSQSHDLKQAQTEHTLSREKILGILEKTDGNKAKSARLLGISRSTLYRKILEFDIE